LRLQFEGAAIAFMSEIGPEHIESDFRSFPVGTREGQRI
jgi:hypothetical protein